jgi:hypothetical protein
MFDSKPFAPRASSDGIWLQKIEFFRCDDAKERRNFTMAVAEKLSMFVYAKGETIACAGSPADQMCIIAKGESCIS